MEPLAALKAIKMSEKTDLEERTYGHILGTNYKKTSLKDVADEFKHGTLIFSRMLAHNIVAPHVWSSRKRLLGKFHIPNDECRDTLVTNYVAAVAEAGAYGLVAYLHHPEYAAIPIVTNIASKMYENHRRKLREQRYASEIKKE